MRYRRIPSKLNKITKFQIEFSFEDEETNQRCVGADVVHCLEPIFVSQGISSKPLTPNCSASAVTPPSSRTTDRLAQTYTF